MLFVDALALIAMEINDCLLEILMQGSVSFVVREKLKIELSTHDHSHETVMSPVFTWPEGSQLI